MKLIKPELSWKCIFDGVELITANTQAIVRCSLSIGGRLRPLHRQDQMVVAEAVQGGNRLGGVLLAVVIDKSKTLKWYTELRMSRYSLKY